MVIVKVESSLKVRFSNFILNFQLKFNNLTIHYDLIVLMVILKSFVEVFKCSCKCGNLSNVGKVIDFSLAFMKTFWIRITTTITQITTKNITNTNSQSQSPNKNYNHGHKHKQNLLQTQTHNHKASIIILTQTTNTNEISQLQTKLLTISKP